MVRDFIYLDVDRLKSIVAQLEEGLTEQQVRSAGRTEEAGGAIAGGILNVVKGSGDIRSLWQDQESETKSLHDFLYNKVEQALLDQNLILRIPDDVEENALAEELLGEWLTPTTFVLCHGRVSINDFRQLRKLMDNFNDIGSFMGRVAGLTAAEAGQGKKEQADIERQTRTQLQLDGKYLKGLTMFLDLFYGERITLKMVPYPDSPGFRLVGNLVPDLLRDKIDSITYKYGTSPANEWVMLAQVAAVPTEVEQPRIPMLGGGEIEQAFHGIFEAVREIEALAQSVVWPEISVTPIAAYRQ